MGDIKANMECINGFSVFVIGSSVSEMTGTASLKIPVDHFIIDFFMDSSDAFMVLRFPVTLFPKSVLISFTVTLFMSSFNIFYTSFLSF